ncbi:hypothetical protein [Rhodohalobacter halophilus]|uniref:hypothetical protein n=1 Tax=Rhodohalobacter halophilus TaxID=1812810 RepID=UPI00083FA80D|nr:hypothetical protein [Rhodohalobacter halophilus]
MKSVLFEELLFGDLLNEERMVNLQMTRLPIDSLSDDPELFIRQRIDLVERVAGSAMKAEKFMYQESGFDRILIPGLQFFRPVHSEPNGKPEWLIRRAAEAEGALQLTRTVFSMNRLDRESDRKYQLTLTLRRWYDYLVQCGELKEQREGDQRSFIYTILAKQLSAMVCDLSFRFRDLKTDEGFSDETIELEMENHFPAGSIKPQKTAEYFRECSIELIRTRELNRNLVTLCEKLRMRAQTDEEDRAAYRTILHHLENAFFLMLYRASFVNRDSQKLEDEAYCREWVTAVRTKILTWSSMEDFEDQIKRLVEAESSMRAAFGDMGRVETNGSVSESVQLIDEVQAVLRGSFSVENGSERRGGATPVQKGSFEEFVRSNFITEHEMMNAFEINDRDTIKTFIEKHTLDYAEVSPRRKLYDRNVVEDILKRFKK